MTTRRPFVGGNWKMNTNAVGAATLAAAVSDAVDGGLVEHADVTICPPFPYLVPVAQTLCDRSSRIMLGAQDIYHEPNGEFTGEVSAAMLADCGVRVVIVGHSERRHVIGETDALINRKVHATLDAGFDCILCIGETIEQRKAGETDAINAHQLRAGLEGVDDSSTARLTIAYEPVWAIGTGLAATPEDAQDAHAKIRGLLAGLYDGSIAESVRIQYGGSMKPANAEELMAKPDIDGGLIGGASLKAGDFASIIGAAAGQPTG